MVVVLAGAHQACAGAWPREAGTGFVSLSFKASTGTRTLLTPMQDLRSYASVYADYGLPADWTIGLEAGRGGGGGDPVYAGLIFVRHPVWRGDAGAVAAAGFGLGVQQDAGAGGTQGRIRASLAYGRGIETGWGDGWVGIESSAELRLPSQDSALKADFTAGLKPSDRYMLIFQVQTGKYPGSAPIVRLAPSVVRRLGEAMHLQLGLNGEVAGGDAIGLSISTWFEF